MSCSRRQPHVTHVPVLLDKGQNYSFVLPFVRPTNNHGSQRTTISCGIQTLSRARNVARLSSISPIKRTCYRKWTAGRSIILHRKWKIWFVHSLSHTCNADIFCWSKQKWNCSVFFVVYLLVGAGVSSIRQIVMHAAMYGVARPKPWRRSCQRID